MVDQPDEWAVDALDLAAYLDRIGHTGPVAPTAATLAALHRAHVAAIPFENLDVLLGRGVDVTLPAVQAKLVSRRRGGYCYEHGTLFAAVLARLGFDVSRLLGRVGGDDLRPRPRTHLALHVRCHGDAGEGGEWLADVGFGSGLLEPLPWGETGPHEQGAWTYRMVRGAENTWQVQQLTGDGWTVLYRLVEEPVHAADVVVANHYTSTHPASPFVGQLVAVRKRADGFLRLRGRLAGVVRPDGIGDERELADGELITVLRDDVGLPLTDDEAAAVLAALPVRPAG